MNKRILTKKKIKSLKKNQINSGAEDYDERNERCIRASIADL